MDLHHSAHATYRLSYHFVWCPRYRRPLLVGPVAAAVASAIQAICAGQGWPVAALNVQPDHVHLLVTAPPSVASAAIAHRLKGASARTALAAFPALRTGRAGGHLWGHSYFVGAVGVVDAAVVRRYIVAGQD